MFNDLMVDELHRSIGSLDGEIIPLTPTAIGAEDDHLGERDDRSNEDAGTGVRRTGGQDPLSAKKTCGGAVRLPCKLIYRN